MEWGTWRVEAQSTGALWKLISTSMPPLRAWLASVDDAQRAHAERVYRDFLEPGVLEREYVLVVRATPMSTTTTLRDEVTDLLQRLIRVDTTNPPGNETAAAELLREYFEASGIECELIARIPERANLVARIPGGDGPTLLFLGHTDVVLADPAEWSVPPFSGELRDGMVWGRGALDMKSEVAANAVAFASLAREGFKPSGDLIFAADGRRGGGRRTSAWSGSARRIPTSVRCDFAINEGGGDRVELEDGRRDLPGDGGGEDDGPVPAAWCKGRSGHASMPRIADNALVNATRLIERIAAFRPEPQLGPEVEAFLQRGARGGAAGARGGRARRAARRTSPRSSSMRCSRRPSRRRSSPPRRSATSSPRSARSRSTAGCCRASIPSTSSR